MPSPSSSFRRYSRDLRRDQTDAERVLWLHLRARQILDAKFRRQHQIGNYIVDFCCLEHALVVELDGSQHMDLTEADHTRTQQLERLGFRVLRFWDNELLTNIGGVLERIAEALKPY